jgi:hypothetical protein
MPITLENRGRQMQVFNLPHELYCEKSGRCGCAQEIVNTWVEDATTGERTLRSTVKRIPASLTLLAREKHPALAEAVLDVPEIQRAIELGTVRVFTERARQAVDVARNKRDRRSAPASTGASTQEGAKDE